MFEEYQSYMKDFQVAFEMSLRFCGVSWRISTLLCLSSVIICQWTTSSNSYPNFTNTSACRELPLEDCEDSASTIFSATIRQLREDQTCAVVEVKRVFKGDLVAANLAHVHLAKTFRQYVEVHGLRNPSICDSAAKVNDTRIFLTNEIGSELHLNSSLMRITVYNIRRIEEAVNGTIPVANEEFTVSKKISALYSASRNLCAGKRCVFGANCVHLADGAHAWCKCSNNCSDNSSSLPICGSDGQNYANVCEMEKTACLEMRSIVKKYDGKCDPCEGISCHSGDICRVNISRQPSCLCSNISCDDALTPVCASNGRTYKNECFMKSESCKIEREIIKLYDGKCSEDNDPCGDFNCSIYSDCHFNQSKAHCVCSQNCGPVFMPVCGSDGNTYDNWCELEKSSCAAGELITISHNGSCYDYHPVCNQPDCSDGARCILIHNQSLCICPSCLDEFNPVCGSNGVSYSSECIMRAENCEEKKNVSVLYRGQCDVCDNIKCHHGSQCKNGTCVCLQQCPELEKPVCASNDITYINECAMQRARCELAMNLKVVHPGECEEQSGSGSGDLCDETTCRYDGQCVLDSNGFPECKCRFSCPALRVTVCGSDGKSYGSECLLREKACNLQKQITVESMDSCEESDEEICDGITPLINSQTKEEYNCTLDWRICPTGSYCHKTASDAKCCNGDDILNETNGVTVETIMETLQITDHTADEFPKGVPVSDTNSTSMPMEAFQITDYTTAEFPKVASVSDTSSISMPTVPMKTPKLLALGVLKGASFLAKSFIQLRRQHSGSTSKFSVELTFVPNFPSGILFYTGQSGSVTGDFFSLALKSGIVEFRFNLGSGMAIIKSNRMIQINKWNRIFAVQSSNHGILMLNDDKEVNGTSKGNFFVLDLENAIFLGLVPIEEEIIKTHIGIDSGFSGCIGLLKVSELGKSYVNYNLTYPGSHDIEKADLHDERCIDYAPGISSLCELNPCAEGKNCISFGKKGYSCVCPGENCDNATSVLTNTGNSLLFDGSTYHVYDINITERQFSHISRYYEITFRTTEKNGMLLLLQNNSTVEMDYLIIVINKGRMKASFKLGNESSKKFIDSKKYVADDQWHTVQFSRNNTVAQLSVDFKDPFSVIFNNGASFLDIDGMLWIGGVDSSIGLSRNYLHRFVGCISSVKINGRTLDLIQDRKTGGHLMTCN